MITALVPFVPTTAYRSCYSLMHAEPLLVETLYNGRVTAVGRTGKGLSKVQTTEGSHRWLRLGTCTPQWDVTRNAPQRLLLRVSQQTWDGAREAKLSRALGAAIRGFEGFAATRRSRKTSSVQPAQAKASTPEVQRVEASELKASPRTTHRTNDRQACLSRSSALCGAELRQARSASSSRLFKATRDSLAVYSPSRGCSPQGGDLCR